MEQTLRNFVTIDSVYGPFIINRHCRFQAEALIKTGRPHIQSELDAMMQIADQLPDDCIAVDGGANAGLVCVPLAQRLRARHGHVHAFEPQRTMYYALCGTVALAQIDNLHVHNMGLASCNATMTVPPVDYGQDADFGSVSLEACERPGGMATPVVRLDALGLERLDFLKLDIEGMEVDALRGARPLLEAHLPWCWIEYWKVGAQAIIAEFAGLDYAFYRMDALNLLCVPLARWNREQLFISGEPVERVEPAGAAAASTAGVVQSAPEEDWNQALAHEARCEWGHAIERWRRALGRGLSDTDIALQMASCCCFAGQVDAGLTVLAQFVDGAPLSEAQRGRVELARSWLLLRADRRAEAATACIASELVLATPLFGLPPDTQYLGQPLAGKRVLVISYGGAGDQLQYARYLYTLEAAGCAGVTVIAPAALAGLLRDNFPTVDVVDAQGAWHDTGNLRFDYWCSFVMLAAQFGFAPQPAALPATPYLRGAAERRQIWRAWVERHSPPSDGAWRLGLNWQGMPETDARFHRASSLRDFAPLAEMAYTASFCINRDLSGSIDPAAARIVFAGEAIRDFGDLAGMIAALDMIVTTCTAHVHLAGALGVPAVLLLSPKADPRWGAGSRTALYPGVQIVRAARVGRWDDAIDQALSIVNAARLASGR